jgi:hypothetical protein
MSIGIRIPLGKWCHKIGKHQMASTCPFEIMETEVVQEIFHKSMGNFIYCLLSRQTHHGLPIHYHRLPDPLHISMHAMNLSQY